MKLPAWRVMNTIWAYCEVFNHQKQWDTIHGTLFQTEWACHSWHKQWSNDKRRLILLHWSSERRNRPKEVQAESLKVFLDTFVNVVRYRPFREEKKSYKTDKKKAIIINIQNLDKQWRVSRFPTKKQNPNLTINVWLRKWPCCCLQNQRKRQRYSTNKFDTNTARWEHALLTAVWKGLLLLVSNQPSESKPFLWTLFA